VAALVFTSDVSERSPHKRSAVRDVLNSGVPCISLTLMQATALSLGPRYSSSFGGIRDGSSGVNDTPSPARGGVLNSPVDASPPDVSIRILGVTYSLTASRMRPSRDLCQQTLICARPRADSSSTVCRWKCVEERLRQMKDLVGDRVLVPVRLVPVRLGR
jgi:hypothetical protein